MQLDAELLAEQAMQQPVDLHMWHRDMLLTLVANLKAIRLPGGFLADDETDAILETLPQKTFEELSEGRWKQFVDLPAAVDTAMEEIESVITALGRYVSINSKQDLRVICAALQTTLKKASMDAMLLSIYETAAKQAMITAGIEPKEYKRLTDSIDQNVIAELNRVTALVRARATEMFTDV